jgi:peptidoglycan/LPS O-acetylase OafA/YrhL
MSAPAPVESNRAPAYRPDIDGLRAIAVLGVVLYHFGIGPLRGGFIGVDIFFVISGYLITGIIHRDIQRGAFSFAKFYERRVRRIFPALFAVLAACLLAGPFLLLPSDLATLGKSALASLSFGSNVLFWRTSGYFDFSSELNPLLHLWSLSVEEQFYIALPVALLWARRCAGGRLRAVLLFGAAVSLAACLAVQPLRPSAVFYLAPFRAWELLAGGLLAVGAAPAIPVRWHRELLSAFALLLLGASLVMIAAGDSFPGWRAIVPVLATAALLHAGAHGTSVARRALEFKPLAFVGTISYSLYLWHWPFLVYAKYLNAYEPLGGWRWVLLPAAALASIASYYWIEQPFRAGAKAPPARLLFRQAGCALAGLGAVSAMLVARDGLPGRFSPRIVALDRAGKPAIPFLGCIDRTLDQNRRGDFCLAGDVRVPPNIWIWGDSHSLAWAPAFDAALKSEGRSGVLAMESSCPPLLGVDIPHDPACRSKNEAVFEQIRRREGVATVVLTASWPVYSGGSDYPMRDEAGREGGRRVFPPAIERTVTALRRAGKSVWIIGPTPGAPVFIPFRVAMAERSRRKGPEAIGLPEFARRASGFDAALPAALAIGGVFYTDPRPWFCGKDGRCDYMRSGELLYRDNGHLSVQGARFVTPYLRSELARVAGAYSTITTASGRANP